MGVAVWGLLVAGGSVHEPRGRVNQPRRVPHTRRVVVDLHPGAEGEEEEEEAGHHLPASQQVLSLLPELEVDQKYCHLYAFSANSRNQARFYNLL